MYKSRVVCFFSEAQSEQPIIYRLVKDYNLVINILKADINPRKEGYLVVELSGNREDYDSGIGFLKDLGVRVEPLSQTVVWQEENCVQCGACASFCPTGALAIDRSEKQKPAPVRVPAVVSILLISSDSPLLNSTQLNSSKVFSF